MSGCCSCQGACAGGIVLLHYFFFDRIFFSLKSTVPLKALRELKNDLS